MLTADVSASSSHGSRLCRGAWAREEVKAASLGSLDVMNGWMDGCVLIATVDTDTSATGTKQCEAITNVAIRIMRLKRDG